MISELFQDILMELLRLFPIQPSPDSIDSLSKNSGIFCVFETFVLFSDTYFIPVKYLLPFFLRNKAIGRDIDKYFQRSFSLFSPVSSLESQEHTFSRMKNGRLS